MRTILKLLAPIAVCSCTHVDVLEVDADTYSIATVCIEQNDNVEVADILSVVERGFIRHGITTSVYDGELPSDCEYSVSYAAEDGWDLKPFLNFAEIRMKKDGKTIGLATYRHGGGFGFNKWASTESKINPIIDELLAEF